LETKINKTVPKEYEQTTYVELRYSSTDLNMSKTMSVIPLSLLELGIFPCCGPPIKWIQNWSTQFINPLVHFTVTHFLFSFLFSLFFVNFSFTFSSALFILPSSALIMIESSRSLIEQKRQLEEGTSWNGGMIGVLLWQKELRLYVCSHVPTEVSFTTRSQFSPFHLWYT
jgi:hypothetical protein